MIELETERLIIRDHTKHDLYDMFEFLSRDDDMYFVQEIKVKNVKEAKDNLKVAITESKKSLRMKYYFAIIDRQNYQYIGEIGYTKSIDSQLGSIVHLGYFIKHEYWNRGITVEAGKKVMAYAFNENNVLKIETGCLKENWKSEKVMIKLGLKKEGELKKHQFHNGEYKDRLIYGILKEEWKR
jgi:[ribosomal protein S5]-alanine N-acetyltransferase